MHVRVRSAATRLWSVTRYVRRVVALVYRRPGQDHRGGLGSVATGSGELEADVLGVDVDREAVGEARRALDGGVQSAQHLFGLEGARRNVREGLPVGLVLFHPEREDRHHVVPHPAFSGFGIEAKVDRAFGQNLYESKPAACDLQLQSLFDGAPGMGPPLVVIKSDPFDIDGPVQAGDQLCHLERLSGEEASALRSRGRSLAEQSRWGHLTAGHAVDGVVDEQDRDRDPELRRAHDFCQAD